MAINSYSQINTPICGILKNNVLNKAYSHHFEDKFSALSKWTGNGKGSISIVSNSYCQMQITSSDQLPSITQNTEYPVIPSGRIHIKTIIQQVPASSYTAYSALYFYIRPTKQTSNYMMFAYGQSTYRSDLNGFQFAYKKDAAAVASMDLRVSGFTFSSWMELHVWADINTGIVKLQSPAGSGQVKVNIPQNAGFLSESLKVSYTTWGWYSGHKSYIDYISVTDW